MMPKKMNKTTAQYGANSNTYKLKVEKQTRVWEVATAVMTDTVLMEDSNRRACNALVAEDLNNGLAVLDAQNLRAFFVGLEAPASAAKRKIFAMHPLRPEEVDAAVAEADEAAKVRAAAEAEEKKAAAAMNRDEKIARTREALDKLMREAAEEKAAAAKAASEKPAPAPDAATPASGKSGDKPAV